jgi:cyanophycinase
MTTPIGGVLGLMGSGEFEPWAEEAERAVLERANGDGSVAIIPLAAALEGETFSDWAAKGLRHYERLGVPARVVEFKTRSDAHDETLLVQLDRASVIFLSGGTPAFLADAVAGSPLGESITRALERGAGVVGCSAGACLLGEAAPESVTDAVDERLWVQGLRLVPNAWVVPHWDALDRYTGGLRAYFRSRVPPDGVLIGVDERTMLVGRGEAWRVFGEGTATVGWRGAERVVPAGSLRLRDLAPAGAVSSQVAEVLPRLPDGAGPIGLLSGGEFETSATDFDRLLLERAGPRVAVVLAAGPGEADVAWAMAEAHYRSLAAEPILVPALERDDAVADALPSDFDVLFLGGGDPARLLRALAGTSLWKEALARWRGGRALAGSSAGAMALCEATLVPEPGADLPATWSRGLGPLRGMALAVHADERPASWLDDVARRAPCPVVAMDAGSGLLLDPSGPPRAVRADGIRLAPA